MRLVVTGGRFFINDRVVSLNLSSLHTSSYGPITLLIHGDADGLDKTAAYVAGEMGIPTLAFPADWDDVTAPGAVIRYRRGGIAYNALAGFWRNQKMIDEGKPDFGLVFPGGNGTHDMRSRMIAAGLKYWKAEA